MKLDEISFISSGRLPKPILDQMEKHKMLISSYGSGLAANFVDSRGKNHTLEFGNISSFDEIVKRVSEAIRKIERSYN